MIKNIKLNTFAFYNIISSFSNLLFLNLSFQSHSILGGILDGLPVALDMSQIVFNRVELLVFAMLIHVLLVECLDILELLVTHALDFIPQCTDKGCHLLKDRVVNNLILEVIFGGLTSDVINTLSFARLEHFLLRCRRLLFLFLKS